MRKRNESQLQQQKQPKQQKQPFLIFLFHGLVFNVYGFQRHIRATVRSARRNQSNKCILNGEPYCITHKTMNLCAVAGWRVQCVHQTGGQWFIKCNKIKYLV